MVIVASDKFKGTFSAEEICRLICATAKSSYPDEEFLIFPMADGGEGTARLIASAKGLKQTRLTGCNPLGKTVEWRFFSDGETVAIDSALIIGIEAIGSEIAPFDASSYPLGELVSRLYANGVSNLYIGVGGTMTTDGGAGFLQAIGWKFLDTSGCLISEHLSPRILPKINKAIPPECQPAFDITALVDVDVPLLPEDGVCGCLSSLSFARQKGVSDKDMPLLGDALSNFQRAIVEALDWKTVPRHYCGAGGGIGFALQVAGAKTLPGALTIWESVVAGNCLSPNGIRRIYTGEGCFDRQSLQGKVTGTILDYGRRNGIPVTVVCGRCELPLKEIPAGTEVILLSDFLTSQD